MKQTAECQFWQAAEAFSSNAEACLPHGHAIIPPVAMLLLEVYSTVDSQPYDEANAELTSLKNELSKLVVFGKHGEFFGGLLHKLRQSL